MRFMMLVSLKMLFFFIRTERVQTVSCPWQIFPQGSFSSSQPLIKSLRSSLLVMYSIGSSLPQLLMNLCSRVSCQSSEKRCVLSSHVPDSFTFFLRVTQKSKTSLFLLVLFVLLYENGFKYSIFRERKLLLGHPQENLASIHDPGE